MNLHLRLLVLRAEPRQILFFFFFIVSLEAETSPLPTLLLQHSSHLGTASPPHSPQIWVTACIKTRRSNSGHIAQVFGHCDFVFCIATRAGQQHILITTYICNKGCSLILKMCFINSGSFSVLLLSVLHMLLFNNRCSIKKKKTNIKIHFILFSSTGN